MEERRGNSGHEAMKILLAAVNSRYIHTNLPVYLLRAYASPEFAQEISLAEYTINEEQEQILADIYEYRPELLMFSCYIWNIREIRELAREYHKIAPETVIWAGGPEVSFHTAEFLEKNPAFTGVMRGEGEETFLELLRAYREGRLPETVRGTAVRTDGGIMQSGERPEMSLDQIPFPYQKLSGFQNRILYYESSRGCPFRCSYCLSSIDHNLRFRSLETVLKELQLFLDARVSQVKFVDRTFNCSRERAYTIWEYLLNHDNGCTNFHFEISADLVREEDLALMRRMRPGLIQLESGIQSTNPETLAAVHRNADLSKIRNATVQIHASGNISQHLDLIAGLPYEDFERFRRSFNDVYPLKAEQLQLGFLKVLPGSPLETEAAGYGIVCRDDPPYEVLLTKWLSYGEICRLKAVEAMVGIYYNSGQFMMTLEAAGNFFPDAFTMFEKLASYYQSRGPGMVQQSRLEKYRILLDFLMENVPDESRALFSETLTWDYYAREHVRVRPDFAPERQVDLKWLKERCGREVFPYIHAEQFQCDFWKDGPGIYIFDYRSRNPVSNNVPVIRMAQERSIRAMKKRTGEILKVLDEEYGSDIRCYLNHQNAWQLLFSTIMSAQCTDARVNIVTETLYRKYDSLEKFAAADIGELEQDIRSTGFYHNKAKNMIACARKLLTDYNGEVPRTIEELTSLPGVGRKTANVIRGNIFNDPSVVVDTHVKRISGRLGLTENVDPEKVEQDLMRELPKDHWISFNIQIITFGRTICTARSPHCEKCRLTQYCREYGKAPKS